MKHKMILPMLPMLLAMIAFAGSKKAEAFDVGVSVGVGHHYHNGGVVEYRTADPVYNTWYPDHSTSYVYTNEPVVEYDTVPYVYSTESVGYDGWYGGGRSGHGGNYGGGRGGESHGGEHGSGFSGGRSSGGGGRNGGGGGGHGR